MPLSSEILLDVSFGQRMPLGMAGLKLVVWKVNPYSGFRQIVHDLFRRQPLSHLRLPETATSIVSSMVAIVRHPVAEDVAFWTENISTYVQSEATRAYQLRSGSFTISAEIKIFCFNPQPPRVVVFPRPRVQLPVSLMPVLQYYYQYQRAEQVDGVMLMSANEEYRNVAPRRRSSAAMKVESVTFEGGDHDESGSTATATDCAICMEEFEQGSKVSKTACSHVFHEPCLSRWLQESNSCPLCRFSLLTDTERERPMISVWL